MWHDPSMRRTLIPRAIAILAVTAALVAACSQKQAGIGAPAPDASTTAAPATTAAPGTTARTGPAFCDRVRDALEVLRDPTSDPTQAAIAFRDLAAAAPDGDVAAGLGKAAALLEDNGGATPEEFDAAVARAREEDPAFARNLARVPEYVEQECGVSIRSSTDTTAGSTGSSARRSTTTTEGAGDPDVTVDSAELFEGGLRSHLAQRYGDQPWFDAIDRFSLVITTDDVGDPKVRAAVGSSTTDVDEATAVEICDAVAQYAGSSELDREVYVTGVDDRILVRSSSYRYQCTPP